MIDKSKFWPLDYDREDEIYENPSWDLPGLRRTRHAALAAESRGAERKRYCRSW